MIMKKNIIRASYISLIGFFIIVIIRLILANKIWSFYNFNMRKVYALIVYLIYVPTVGIITISTAFVIYYYFKLKIKISLKYFCFVIPSLIYMFIFILAMLGISYKFFF